MMARTVHADGVTWPLDTYIDALAFQRVDTFQMPVLDHQMRVATVTVEGKLQPITYVSHVVWHEVVAFKPIEGTREAAPCRSCGEPCFNFSDDICESCDAESWWPW